MPGSRETAHRQDACCCRVRHELLCWGSGRALAGVWGSWGLWRLQRVLVAALKDGMVSTRDALHAALLQGRTNKASGVLKLGAECKIHVANTGRHKYGAENALHACSAGQLNTL